MNEQQNIQSETPVEYNTNLNNLNETPKPKKSHGGAIIIFLLVLIILGLVGYIAYDKGYLDKYLKKEETKEIENVETEIKDTNIIKALDERLDILNNYKANLVDPTPDLYKKLNTKDITDGEKLYSVLLYMYVNKKGIVDNINNYPNFTYEEFKKEHNLTDEDFDELAFNPYYDEDYEADKVLLFKSDDVKKLYKEVYGVEPTNTVVENHFPYFYYEKEYDSYFVVLNGGGACGIYFKQYNYKYTEDKDYAYIYTAVAYYNCEPYVYKDIELSKQVDEIPGDTFESAEEIVSSDYVKNNMDKLNKYRVVFKKDGNNYVFEKVEEVK